MDVQYGTETSTDEKMHVLDETCWCKPTVEIVPAGHAIKHSRVADDK
jgi:hypothetical protein